MKNNSTRTPEKLEADSTNSEALHVIAEALRGLQFGTVKLIVQDSVLIRVERTENRQMARRIAPP